MKLLRAGAVVDYEDELVAVIRHDARTLPLDDATVDLICCSPPYFALRSYRDDGEHYDGQIGSEDTPEEWLDALDECMVEWGRVLKPSGSIWINLGDRYAAKPNQYGNQHAHGKNSRIVDDGRTPEFGNTSTKSLMGLPWRFAIRQIDAGWILRAEVVWDKPNGLPESVTDRVRRSHETWFHFVREPRYFSGVDEIREPQTGGSHRGRSDGQPPPGGATERLVAAGDHGGNYGGTNPDLFNPLGRLPGSVWTIPSEPLLIPDDTREALDLPDHFAAFPQEWPRRIILGWSPIGICTKCREALRPVVTTFHEHLGEKTGGRTSIDAMNPEGHGGGWDGAGYPVTRSRSVIDAYVCACLPPTDAPTTPSLVVDPFGGTGTTAGVAKTLGRYGISNDLSASYNRLAIWRITQSGHFTKTEQRSWADRQGQLL